MIGCYVYGAVFEINDFIGTTGIDRSKIWDVLDSYGIEELNGNVPRWFIYFIHKLMENSAKNIQVIVSGLNVSASVGIVNLNTFIDEIKDRVDSVAIDDEDFYYKVYRDLDNNFIYTVSYSIFGCLLSEDDAFFYPHKDWVDAKNFLNTNPDELKKILINIIYNEILEIFKYDVDGDNVLRLVPLFKVYELNKQRKRDVLRDLINKGSVSIEPEINGDDKIKIKSFSLDRLHSNKGLLDERKKEELKRQQEELEKRQQESEMDEKIKKIIEQEIRVKNRRVTAANKCKDFLERKLETYRLEANSLLKLNDNNSQYDHHGPGAS